MLKPSKLEDKFTPALMEKKLMRPVNISMKFHKLHVKKGATKKR